MISSHLAASDESVREIPQFNGARRAFVNYTCLQGRFADGLEAMFAAFGFTFWATGN